MSIPDYIEQRIRRDVPSNLHVVPGSTPVVSFGNVTLARVATLGLNPSRQEFLDQQGNELTGSSRRLATHTSLGTSDLTHAPEAIIRQAWDDSNTYFSRNPYRKWFDQLEPILKACGASYYDGSACHLDLVQLATDPTWAKLKPASSKKSLLRQDIPFLMEQLATERIELLLLNGIGVCRQVNKHVTELGDLPSIEGASKNCTRLFSGLLFGRVRIFGWSTNIQSSYGVTKERRQRITKRVAEWAAEPLSW